MHTARELELRSSAVTLSDMEIFVFPELMYALVLANIMSPRLWQWREDPWFEGLEKMKPYRRITRLRQFIMDHYAFNLDLDTWGLTTKPRELSRFREFLDEKVIAESNALFGYEGDRYYFDLDIRTHFGLDKYTNDTIPYWKTETVEAMDAFRFKEGYTTGAGECVSLSTLYAAALFVVAGLPLSEIYLMATPLHSQNFIDLDDGILTNNRRLVTKKMWYNGTALSAQARRALENEQVTVVTHETGYVHAVYSQATIDGRKYEHLCRKLRAFLKTSLTDEILGNFLRHRRDLQRCFQLRRAIRGVDHYVSLDVVFQYENGCSYLVTDNTRESLLAEIDMDEFQPVKMPGKIVLDDLEAFIRQQRLDLGQADDVGRLKHEFACDCLNAELAIESLVRFCRIEPKVPDAAAKSFAPPAEPLGLTRHMSRADIIRRLEAIRGSNAFADLAFYAYRDLTRTDWRPFVHAAMERSPVSIEGTKAVSDEEIVNLVRGLPDESIYDEAGRLAQPDEVWNYKRGDGVEKALLLANLLHSRHPGEALTIDVAPDRAVLRAGARQHDFASRKALKAQTWYVTPA